MLTLPWSLRTISIDYSSFMRLDVLKAHLVIEPEVTDHDALLTSYILSFCHIIENQFGFVCGSGHYILDCNSLNDVCDLIPNVRTYNDTCLEYSLLLPRTPVTSIESIKYHSRTNPAVLTTLSNNRYQFTPNSTMPLIVDSRLEIEIENRANNSLQVEFKCVYSSNPSLEQFARVQIAEWFAVRESGEVRNISKAFGSNAHIKNIVPCAGLRPYLQGHSHLY